MVEHLYSSIERENKMKQCSVCKQEKEASTSYFWASRFEDDGLHHECRPCAAAARRDVDRGMYSVHKEVKAKIFSKKQEVLSLLAKGFKKCEECKETLPVTSFHKHHKGLTKLQTYCIECRKKMKAVA